MKITQAVPAFVLATMLLATCLAVSAMTPNSVLEPSAPTAMATTTEDLCGYCFENLMNDYDGCYVFPDDTRFNLCVDIAYGVYEFCLDHCRRSWNIETELTQPEGVCRKEDASKAEIASISSRLGRFSLPQKSIHRMSSHRSRLTLSSNRVCALKG